MRFRLASTLRVFGWVAFFFLLSAPAIFLAGANNDSSFVIRNARVFDGHRVTDQADVWVENGRIKAIGNGIRVLSGVKEVDATSDTLLPGLIDSHTHAWGDALKEAEIFGVTTELDMFTDVKYMQKIKEEQAERQISRPRGSALGRYAGHRAWRPRHGVRHPDPDALDIRRGAGLGGRAHSRRFGLHQDRHR